MVNKMTRYGFFFDEHRCVDCRACSMACRDWNDLQSGGARLLRRFTWEEGLFPETVMHTLLSTSRRPSSSSRLGWTPTGWAGRAGDAPAVDAVGQTTLPLD